MHAQPECASRAKTIDRTERVFFIRPQALEAPSKNALPYDGWSSGATIYAYVSGNPLLLVDPSGLDATVCLYPGAGTAGHVGIGVNSSSTVGFYPKDSGVSALFGTPGEVKRDEKGAEACKTVKTSPADDKKMSDYIAARTAAPGNYSLAGSNCTAFVRSVLQQGNVQTAVSPGPRPFFEAVPGKQ